LRLLDSSMGAYCLPDPDFATLIFVGVPDDKDAGNGRHKCSLARGYLIQLKAFKLDPGSARMATIIAVHQRLELSVRH
jgi:hypothetical protein